jgi:hypothetical protein
MIAMKRPFPVLALFLVLILNLSNCSDSPSEPQEDLEPYPAGVVTSYSTEGETSVSGPCSPASGATYYVTASNGVEYDLSIAPGAVESEVTITITPFSEISMRTEMSDGTVGEPDTSSCLVGALFEPEGLVFDSTAVLTITFPDGFECEMSDTLSIVCLDSSLAFYEIMETNIDEIESSLTCTLTHFSGYGSYNPNCDCLESIINAAIAYGTEFPSDHAIDILAGHLDFAISWGCDDMAELALDGIHDVFAGIAADAIADANADPTEANLQNLIIRLEQVKQWGFTDIQATLESAIESVLRALAAQGKALCASGEHEQGRAILSNVLIYIMGGYLDDPDFAAQVQDDLDNCGAPNVTLEADKGTITDYAMHENDTSTFVTFVATVIGYSGDPQEGVSVVLYRKPPGGEYNSCAGGVTDESGIAMMRYGYAASPINQELEGTHTFRATATTENGTGESSEIPVTFQRTKLNVDYTYDYSESRSDDYSSFEMIIHARAIGWTTSHIAKSDAYITRNITSEYYYSFGDHWNTIDCELVDDPRRPVHMMIQGHYDLTVSPDEFHTQMTVLDIIYIYYTYPFNIVTLRCVEDWDNQPAVVDTNTSYSYYDRLGGAWPDGYDGRFENDGSGTFSPFLFEGDNLSGGHGSMQISVFLSQ